MNTILVIGANGMLGSDVNCQLRLQDFDVNTPSSSELDIRDHELVDKYIAKIKPAWIINCSAWTKVEEAEEFPELAAAVNEIGVRNIAQISSKYGSRLIHISTDYVFDGVMDCPYSECDIPKPINVYGLSKYLGEQEIMKIYPGGSYIVRTSWLYGIGGQNFVRKMVQKALNNEVVRVVSDQIGCPTSARDLSSALLSIIHNPPETGLYHFTNLGECSWYEFAREIYSLVGKNKDLVLPILSSSLNLKAKRPRYSVLSKDRWINSGFNKPAPWRQSLSSIVLELVELESQKGNS